MQANPDLQLHHMHDANQDRLMVQRMTYFRIKRLRLGEAYERFLEECLAPGGNCGLVAVDCQQAPARLDRLKQRARMAAAAEGAVDDDRPRPGLKELY